MEACITSTKKSIHTHKRRYVLFLVHVMHNSLFKCLNTSCFNPNMPGLFLLSAST